MRNFYIFLLIILIGQSLLADSFDQQMDIAVKRYNIPSVSIAIIENNQIVKAKIYSSKPIKILLE